MPAPFSPDVRICTSSSSGAPTEVERFFRTVDDECLHVRPLYTFAVRTRAVDDFVWYYNPERPHFSLAGMAALGRKLYFSQAE
jgi:transposase InsO family protein